MVKSSLWKECWVIVKFDLFNNYWTSAMCQVLLEAWHTWQRLCPALIELAFLHSSCRRLTMNNDSHRIATHTSSDSNTSLKNIKQDVAIDSEWGWETTLIWGWKEESLRRWHLIWYLNDKKMPAAQKSCKWTSRYQERT